MLYFLKRVGLNCAIVDTDDGAVDWIDMEELMALVKGGMSVTGVDATSGTLEPQEVILPGSKCNWDDGKNIFAGVRSFMLNKRTGRFEMRSSGKKKFKGVVLPGGLHFNSGVVVRTVWEEWNTLMEGNEESTLAVLKNLATK